MLDYSDSQTWPLGPHAAPDPVSAAPELIFGFEKIHIQHEQNVAK